jgi:diguanylate cyclase (GGDEF)-like protein
LLYSIGEPPVNAWEQIIARPLRALHLDTIRSKFLVFAVLATVIPTVATILVPYRQSRRLLDDNIAQELRGASSEAARETDLWLDARLEDLRVSAGSYVIPENLARLQGREDGQALGRLRDYLNSVRQRFPDLEALVVMDERGRVVASSSGRTGSVRIPPDRLNALRTGNAFVGEAYWDAVLGKAAIVLAVPIRQADGLFLGAFTAKVNLQSLADILQRLSPDRGRDVYLMTDEGRLVIRSRVSSENLMRTRLAAPTASALFDREGQTVVYRRADGQEVVGALQRVPQLGWAAVAEMPRAEAARQADRLRNVTALMISALLGGVGLMAYVLGLLIVRPLGRLTAAAKVAAGGLPVDLPVSAGDEVSFVTQVFNALVARLRERESQKLLERLSETDALTGLYNRRHLMGTLASEAQRSRRLRRPFSVLLADVDHFKKYNDTHGHLAGDAALVKIGDILRKMTRAVDWVARYGGEEFLVVLLETTIATAAVVAERIRAHVAAEAFGEGRMTMSIGVAECPAHGDTAESLIASADAAMYQAKSEGRDRVVTAGGKGEGEKEKKRRRKGDS